MIGDTVGLSTNINANKKLQELPEKKKKIL